jgi:hypothetical protein
MSSWNRRFLALVLGGVLLVGVGCSSADDATGPSPAAPEASILSTVLGSVDLLTCRSLPYAAGAATVGPEGGPVRVGKVSLIIPRGALSSRVTIKAEQMPGKANSVRFSPEGLRFARPAQLTMSYDNCLLVLPTKRIVYTTEGLKVLELLKSLDLRLQRSVSASIEHFSRYAIAY